MKLRVLMMEPKAILRLLLHSGLHQPEVDNVPGQPGEALRSERELRNEKSDVGNGVSGQLCTLLAEILTFFANQQAQQRLLQ